MPNYKRNFQNNGYVFVTIVSYNRESILVKNIDLLRKAFKNSKKFYEYEIFAIVILPEHLHMIIKPEKIEDYPKIISRIKHYFSRNMTVPEKKLSHSKFKKREKGIWQRRYWEHTIRDEDDLYKHLDYIHYNPVKHALVTAVKNWEYNSFHKFVEQKKYDRNWGAGEDVRNIIDLDFE